jgi:hypothetical protein
MRNPATIDISAGIASDFFRKNSTALNNQPHARNMELVVQSSLSGLYGKNFLRSRIII